MSLFDYFQPKWKHRDAATREHAVLELKRQDVLEAIVNDDPSEQVRVAAVTKITDQRMLARFACRSDAIALAAMKRLTDRTLITDVGLRSASPEVRELAVDLLDDRVVLHRIANSDTNPHVRLKARKKHQGPDAMREVIQNELSRLQLTQLALEKTPEFSGTLDEVCRALVSNASFCITGTLEPGIPGQATIRELDHDATAVADAQSTVTAARFLALKRTESAGSDHEAARTFYAITVWRTGESTFQCSTEEKHLDMVLNPVMWSSVSNGATFGSMRSKQADGVGALSAD